MAAAGRVRCARVSIGEVVERLCASPAVTARRAAGVGFEPPSRPVLIDVLEGLRSALFPGYFGLVQMTEGLSFHVGAILEEKLRHLQEQILRGLVFARWQDRDGAGTPDQLRHRNEAHAAAAVSHLLARLPELQRLVLLDVEAAYTGDPAAISRDEVIFSYPGVQTIIQHRIAHELYLLDIPLIPRIMSEHAHSTTGIDIHPGAAIGESFFIDHGTGVVIGETCEIGRNVRIYQGATLGAKSFPLDVHGQPIKGVLRHPIVEDEVIIYSGATILGRTRLGRGSIIGANAWVTRDVEPGAIVTRYHGEKDDLRVEPPT
jgi:serine O-acetyltransferase